MLPSCAVEGGDPGVAELVQNLGADGAWAKIIEACSANPWPSVQHRSRSRCSSGWLKRRRHVSSCLATTSGRAGLMIFDMPNPSSGAAANRLVCGSAVRDILLI